MWKHGTLLPSQGVKELSGFLSSGHRGLGLFLKVPRDCHTSLHVFFFFCIQPPHPSVAGNYEEIPKAVLFVFSKKHKLTFGSMTAFVGDEE